MGSIRARKIKDGVGHLVIDFRYQGIRCREQTLLQDTPANRERLQKALDKIEREIAAGGFVYARYFPHSKNAEKFRPNPSQSHTGTPLFRDFAEIWMIENSVRWKRSVIQGYRYTLDSLLLPRFGHYEVGAIAKADILAFRTELSTIPGKGGKQRSPSRSLSDYAQCYCAAGEADQNRPDMRHMEPPCSLYPNYFCLASPPARYTLP